MELNDNKKINAYCRKIKEADLQMIMEWRMRDDITKYMNSDPILTLDDQRKWLKKINDNQNEWHWLLEVDGVPAGVVSLTGFDGNLVHTGVYIAEKSKRSIKLIVYIQWNLYRFSFDVLKVNKVCEEVFEANKDVNRILDMCGSKKEGILRNQVLKKGIFYNIVCRGILKDEWTLVKSKRNYDKIEFEL